MQSRGWSRALQLTELPGCQDRGSNQEHALAALVHSDRIALLPFFRLCNRATLFQWNYAFPRLESAFIFSRVGNLTQGSPAARLHFPFRGPGARCLTTESNYYPRPWIDRVQSLLPLLFALSLARTGTAVQIPFRLVEGLGGNCAVFGHPSFGLLVAVLGGCS